jgi:hypothetical protein
MNSRDYQVVMDMGFSMDISLSCCLTPYLDSP